MRSRAPFASDLASTLLGARLCRTCAQAGRAVHACLLIVLLSVIPSGMALACAFHFTDLPEAPLSRQVVESYSLIAARPDPTNPFSFVVSKVLHGAAAVNGPPHLVDSTTRRRLKAAPGDAVLFSRNADGTWTRLLLLDATTRPVVAHMLAEAGRWSAPGGAAARRDFAASLLAHTDLRLHHIALRELDSLDYGTLRAGTYDVPTGQLIAGIADLQGQAFAPIRIQLLGLTGGARAEAEVARQLQWRFETGLAPGLGAWTTAALELQGTGAIAELERMLSERYRPLPRAQIDEVVQALAVQSAAGDPEGRSAARAALLLFVNRYPNASFFARGQALVSSVFVGAMSVIKSGASTSSVLFAVLVSFLYGALHTLGPGHGKAVVISYFAGAGGSVRRGLKMGAQIAVTHVLSAIVIVVLLDFAVRQATGNAPSDYRLIRLASYAAITTIGAFMLWRAVQAVIDYKSHNHAPVHADHHRHDHGHHHHHRHSSGCASCEAAAKQVGKGAGWLATAVGVVPCTGALMVMLYGLANDLVGPAVIMVIAISTGMAAAMAAIGLAAIWGHNLAAARWGSNEAQRMRFTLGAQLAGATAVLLIGAGLFALTVSAPVSLAGTSTYSQNSKASMPAQAIGIARQ